MMTKAGSITIVNFMTPGPGFLMLRCGHMSYGENALFFFNLLLYSQAKIRQTKFIVMMTKEGSHTIVTFMTPGQGFLR